MKLFDNSFLTNGVKLLAGIDEAGRGPLAGPVVAAAVIFSKDVFIEGVDDSKKLTEPKREELYEQIIQKSLAYSVSAVSPKTIDKMNILRAALTAMKRSVNNLNINPDLLLIDGNKTFRHRIPCLAIVKGDSKSFSIAAASILAKVCRDRIMKKLSCRYPQYLWYKNKGYPTKEHIDALRKYGPSPLHRKTFLGRIINLDLYEFEQ